MNWNKILINIVSFIIIIKNILKEKMEETTQKKVYFISDLIRQSQ